MIKRQKLAKKSKLVHLPNSFLAVRSTKKAIYKRKNYKKLPNL